MRLHAPLSLPQPLYHGVHERERGAPSAATGDRAALLLRTLRHIPCSTAAMRALGDLSRLGCCLLLAGSSQLSQHAQRHRSVRLTEIPSTLSLGDIITASLDRHAQRQQRVIPTSTRLISLCDATAADWRLVVDALAPFMREKRVRGMERALRHRRANLHLVVENIADPFNAASLLRTAEALGVQHVHVIDTVSAFQLPASDARDASRGALGRSDAGNGASRWLSIHRHASSAATLDALRALRLKVYVSDCPTDENEDGTADGAAAAPAPGKCKGEAEVNEGMGWVVTKRGAARAAVSIDSLEFEEAFRDGACGAALVFGNERRGCSRFLAERCDGTFYLPMGGFTQSFNIGVAVGMSLAAAVETGRFHEGTLGEDDRVRLLGRWLLRDIKGATACDRTPGSASSWRPPPSCLGRRARPAVL